MGKKGGGSQNVTMRLDRGTQRYVDESRRIAGRGAERVMRGQGGLMGPTYGQHQAVRGISGAGAQYNPYMMDMMKQGAGAMGNLGFAMGPMDPSQINQYMNPYLSNVVDATRGEFDYMRDAADTQAMQQATGAGAGFGSRAAVMRGERAGQLDRAQASTMADLYSSGFGQAMQNYMMDRDRTGQLALGAGGLASGIGQFGSQFDLARANQSLQGQEMLRALQERAGNEGLWRNQQALELRNLGMGPHGTSQSGGGGSNTFGNVLGGAATGFGIGGPVGGIIGGGLGLLGGLFG